MSQTYSLMEKPMSDSWVVGVDSPAKFICERR